MTTKKKKEGVGQERKKERKERKPVTGKYENDGDSQEPIKGLIRKEIQSKNTHYGGAAKEEKV